jgi:hypothetical protein
MNPIRPTTSLDQFITDHLPDDYHSPRHFKWLRIVLAGLAVMIIAALIIWPRYREAQISADQPVVRDTGGMDNAVLDGTNNNGNPYQIRADKLMPMAADGVDPGDNNQSDLDANRLTLQSPSADITLGDNQWMAVRADTGKFNRLDQELTLTGDVFVTNQDGWSATAGQTRIDLADQELIADGGVTAQSPMGQITAPAMTIGQDGDHIRFHGPAKLTLTGNGRG